MEENKKSSWFLWIGLAIPIVVLISVAIMAYMPSSLVAKYDFLYYYNSYDYNYSRCYNNNDVYGVKNQKVMESPRLINDTWNDQKKCADFTYEDLPRIYRYNVLTDESTQISLAETQNLLVDNNAISPDGISIQRGGYNNLGIFELFGSNNNYRDVYLKNNKDELKKISINNSENYYDFKLIGWIIK